MTTTWSPPLPPPPSPSPLPRGHHHQCCVPLFAAVPASTTTTARFSCSSCCPGEWRRTRTPSSSSRHRLLVHRESAPHVGIFFNLLLPPPPPPLPKNYPLAWSFWRSQGRSSSSVRVWEDTKGDDDEVVVLEEGRPGFDEEEASTAALEVEIYEFMMSSPNPRDFPTKEQLIAAGRTDLVDAIASHGGWLALGWALDDEEEKEQQRGYGLEQEGEAGVEPSTSTSEHGNASGWVDDNTFLRQQRFGSTTDYASSSAASVSGRPIETEVWDESGIKGILTRLEEGRTLSYAVGAREKIVNGQISSKNNDYGLGARVSEVVTNGNRNGADTNVSSDLSMDDNVHTALQCANEMTNDQQISLKELYRLSDALEFQETEIMNARDRLRSTRAKLAVLEGKMALEIIEAQKVVEEKQKRIDAAQNALCLLSTAYVVWPNTASEVLLAGSFDGWTSQRRMERSSTGIFSLSLKLYPGQYEIKFIVDGIWKIDPLRPIVHNNGYENNLLVIS